MSAAQDIAELIGPLLVSTDAEDLDRHAYDMSTEALLSERDATRSFLPACIVRPRETADVAAVLEWADRTRTPVVPAGGRSGVVRGIEPAGAVVVDLTEMTRIVDLDEKSRLVRVQAGVNGAILDDWLGERDLRLGHEPQSIAISTVGGWIATRATGQLSSAFGGIERLVAGLEAVLPGGRIVSSSPAPRRATGPQVADLMIGSEGTLGIVTEATLRVAPVAHERVDACIVFEHMADGVAACRTIAQSELGPVLVRLYDREDAAYVFRKHRGTPAACLLLLSFEGHGSHDRAARATAAAAGEPGDADIVSYWWSKRNDAVEQYRRIMAGEGVLGPHALVDTVEVAGRWSALRSLYHEMKDALAPLADHVGCHLSHAYPDGACLYFTLGAACSDDDEAHGRHERWWETAATTCLGAGGTLSHHHGIGRLKARWLPQEMGGWWEVLVAVKRAIDPNGIMNPGALGL